MLLSLDASLLRHGVEDECLQFKGTTRAPSKGPGYPPVFAFRISGTGGEHHKILRLPMALYHPRNRYLLHLDAACAVEGTGASAVAATLHAAAALLKTSPYWDRFINLSASDYPAITQDDLLHAFTSLPRDLNFIDRMNPSLHLDTNTRIVYGTGNGSMPDAFKMFTGSPRVVLSRSFVEHRVLGVDNLPR
ncbi:unnamed protein product, partial [Musa acuminata var. zebrina]